MLEGMVSKAKGEFIGIAGILLQEIENEIETEISYRIDRKYWNNGYATEAAIACLEYARLP
jgi:RimJ/RimL family protein N-acetyltransferase